VKTCVCGHIAKHHTRRDSVYAGLMADYRVVWRCAWKGCGCPEYVTAPAQPDDPAQVSESARLQTPGGTP
jgi:hypothetical protein